MPLIRPLAPADAGAVSALARASYADAFGAGLSPSALAAALDGLSADAWGRAIAADTCLGAEVAGHLAGVVQIGIDADAAAAELRRLYVAPSAQGQGLGALLLDTALAQEPARSATRVVLDVWPRNARAVALYASRGFVVTGERIGEIGGVPLPEPDWIMQRPNPAARGMAHA